MTDLDYLEFKREDFDFIEIGDENCNLDMTADSHFIAEQANRILAERLQKSILVYKRGFENRWYELKQRPGSGRFGKGIWTHEAKLICFRELK